MRTKLGFSHFTHNTKESIMDNYVLRNGYKIPEIGFGTWKMDDKEATVKAVVEAISCLIT